MHMYVTHAAQFSDPMSITINWQQNTFKIYFYHRSKSSECKNSKHTSNVSVKGHKEKIACLEYQVC
jgi:hypothetical protein